MPEPAASAKQKRAVFQRAGGCCEYCRSQARFALQSFSIEHIIPRSRSGPTELANLALACQGCNSHNYTHVEARDPLGGEWAALFHPRRQR